MARLKKLYIGRKLLDLPHPFEEEVNWLVRTNYHLLCEGISRIEQDGLLAAERFEDPNDVGDAMADTKSSADELRREARGLTLVRLVTRFQHWLRVFVGELNKKVANGVVPNMQTLNDFFGVRFPPFAKCAKDGAPAIVAASALQRLGYPGIELDLWTGWPGPSVGGFSFPL